MRIFYTKDNVPRLYLLLGNVYQVGMRFLPDKQTEQLRVAIVRYADKKWPTL